MKLFSRILIINLCLNYSSSFNFGIHKKSLFTKRNVRNNFNLKKDFDYFDDDDFEDFLDSIYEDVYNEFELKYSHFDKNNTLYKDYRQSLILPNKINIKNAKSDNFEVIKESSITFNNIGGYHNIKKELMQCSELLTNQEKFKKYDLRTPKGIILEGPPGNGKTMLAKGLCGTLGISFIQVSGSAFQEKFVGIGPSRIRELFKLARENIPCIIFIDEVDSVGRKRNDGFDGASTERDSTLNELLVQLDGFEENNGVFLMLATNRVDLLDNALLRPGRIDKKIFIDNPDRETRREIIEIYTKNKPISYNIKLDYLVDLTNGLSCAEIENIFNEVMFYVLFNDREVITIEDLDIIMNRFLSGYQDKKILYSDEMTKRIIIHELGHALSGYFIQNHSKLSRIRINLNSPTTPGITIFEKDEIDSNIFTFEKLFSHLVVLLSGKTAEEIYFDNSISTGASRDLEEAYKLAHNMILKYGMGSKIFSSVNSDFNKYLIDKEIENLVEKAYKKSKSLLSEKLTKQLTYELIDIIINNNGIDKKQIDEILSYIQ